ncbi:MAG: InlB B-repeat-containing protein, partial [Spirochaetales bacterium]|nr:InlB B-repeat-containing protein [Spirochaetales bacterium]
IDNNSGTGVYMSDGEWYENAVGSGKYYIGNKESGANNLLLSSVYKVSFDTDGGSAAPADQYIAKNSLVTEPAADPTKDNFTFDKWMLSGQDGEGNPTYSDWDFATDTVQMNKQVVNLKSQLPQSFLEHNAVIITVLNSFFEFIKLAEYTETAPIDITKQYRYNQHKNNADKNHIFSNEFPLFYRE